MRISGGSTLSGGEKRANVVVVDVDGNRIVVGVEGSGVGGGLDQWMDGVTQKI